MRQYLLLRGAYYLSIFLGIIFFSFVLFHIIPSDPARTILGPNAEQGQVEALRKKLGLDKPFYLRLAVYFKNILRLDFGRSYVDSRNVFDEVTARLTITLSLIGISMVMTFGYVLIVTIGFLFPGSNRLSDLFDFLTTSLPVFFSGVIVAVLSLYTYPVTTFSGNIGSFSDILYLLPPAAVLSFYPMAILSGILKKEMSVILQTPYIMAEKSWGFPDIIVLFVYASRNALIPLLSALSNILPALLTGAFIVEIIFSIPGTGSLLVKSILEQDFPMLECTVIINGAFFVVVNLMFEYIYPIVDPRIVKRNHQ